MQPPSSYKWLFALLLVTGSVLPGAAKSEVFTTYRSLDQGRSWTRSDAGLPPDARINAFHLFKDALVAATDTGVFISRDEGRQWQLAYAPDSLSRPLCLASFGNQLFLGTDGGGVLGTEDGKTWRPLNDGLSSRTIRSLLFSEGTLFAGTDHDGVFKSEDAGQHWTPFINGLPVKAQVHQMAVLEGTLFAALYSQGLYRRAPGESSWQRAGRVVPLALTALQTSLIAGHNPGGLHWSSDRGDGWQPSTAGESLDNLLSLAEPPRRRFSAAPVWALASNSTHAFAGALDGIFVSDDRGQTWSRAALGLPPACPGVAFLATDRLILATTLTHP